MEALVEARRKRGLTQRDVARLMGTAPSAVSALERVGGDARYSTLQRYARVVGARLHSLVDRTGSAVTPARQPTPGKRGAALRNSGDHEYSQA